MNLEFSKSFEKQLDKISDVILKKDIANTSMVLWR